VSLRSLRNATDIITVYTFLATLVLLLSVSAAIILRSLLLRRRHRRMVEEAIRNGTWIPPSPGGLGGFGIGLTGRDRFDPNKKPQMWEAYVEKKEDLKAYTESEWDWESVRPFSAIVATSNAALPVVPSPPDDSPSDPVSTRNTITIDTNNATMNNEAVPLTRRILQFINPPPPTLVSALPEQNIRPNDNANSSPNVNETTLPSGPQKIRVSVLIAMPQPHTHNGSRSSTPMSSPSPRNSSTPLSHPSLPLSRESWPLGPPPSHLYQENEEEKLPPIELGVAEFMVRDVGSTEDTEARVLADGKRPLSMGSSMV
jgi:hypothetical protein